MKKEPSNLESKYVICYACKTDFDYHLGHDVHGMDIYFGLDDLKRRRTCVSGCGAVRFLIDVTTAEVVLDPNDERAFSEAKSVDEWRGEEKRQAIEEYKQALKRLKKIRAYKRQKDKS